MAGEQRLTRHPFTLSDDGLGCSQCPLPMGNQIHKLLPTIIFDVLSQHRLVMGERRSEPGLVTHEPDNCACGRWVAYDLDATTTDFMFRTHVAEVIAEVLDG